MKSTRILIILFAVLGSLTAWYLLTRNDADGTTTLGWDRKIAVEDIDEVHKIFLGRRDGTTTTLTRTDDGWTVNDRYRANDNVMKNLLDAIEDVELQSQPAQAALEPIVKDLATRGIYVQLFDKNGEQIKAYTVGGTTTDERGTYFILDGSDQPYVMQLPFLDGGLRSRYALAGDQWRDKRIFRENPDDIVAVRVDYPKQRNKSFELKRDGGNFTVEPLYPTTAQQSGAPDPAQARAYLTVFGSVFAEAFENNNPKAPEQTKAVPFAQLQLTRRDGSTRTVDFHPFLSTDNYGNIKGATFDRYFVRVSEDTGSETLNDYMLAQHRVVTPVFYGYDSFF